MRAACQAGATMTICAQIAGAPGSTGLAGVTGSRARASRGPLGRQADAPRGRVSIAPPIVRLSHEPHPKRRSPMRYVMFVCGDPAAEPYDPDEDNVQEWVAEMDRRKVRILGQRLMGVEHATTVRLRQGKVLVTDGPF